jgi:SDR family mycofactocin-dependent oxidoreductase
MENVVGKLDGKVAFITGAARGQGRSHAIRLAQEGADIIAIDICKQLESVVYPMSTPEDLQQTVKEVEALGRRIVAREADVRNYDELKAAYQEGVAELGPVTIAVANAGIGPSGLSSPEVQWDEVIDVNLKGVWNTGRVVLRPMIKNKGGSFVITASVGGLRGPGLDAAGLLGYTAAKHGLIGLMRSWANFAAPHFVRVNCIAPTTVATPMANMGDLSHVKEMSPEMARSLTNAIPVDFVEPIDISNGVLFLVSDEARYVTGTVLPVDAGAVNYT